MVEMMGRIVQVAKATAAVDRMVGLVTQAAVGAVAMVVQDTAGC